MEFKRKQLELKTKLAKAHAKGLVYSEAESSQVGNYPEFHRVAKPEGNSAALLADFAQPKWRSQVPENLATNPIQWSSQAPTAATYFLKWRNTPNLKNTFHWILQSYRMKLTSTTS